MIAYAKRARVSGELDQNADQQGNLSQGKPDHPFDEVGSKLGNGKLQIGLGDKVAFAGCLAERGDNRRRLRLRETSVTQTVREFQRVESDCGHRGNSFAAFNIGDLTRTVKSAREMASE